jgi:hypothetical protein
MTPKTAPHVMAQREEGDSDLTLESERRQHLVNRIARALASWNVAGVVYVALVLVLMSLLFAA